MTDPTSRRPHDYQRSQWRTGDRVGWLVVILLAPVAVVCGLLYIAFGDD